MLPIGKTTTKKLYSRWSQFIDYKEFGLFVWPPNSGPGWRILNFIESERSTSTKKCFYVYLDLNDRAVTTKAEFYGELLLSISRELETNKITTENTTPTEIFNEVKDKGYKTALFVTGIDQLVSDNYLIFNILEAFHRESNYLPVLVFITKYIDSDDIAIKMFSKRSSSSNIYYKPLYSKEDSLQFIKYMEKMWNMSITHDQKKWIIDNCAGKLGIIKNALRVIRNDPKAKVSDMECDSTIINRMKSVLDSLSPEIVTVLKSINTNHSVASNTKIIKYLKGVGLIKMDNGQYKVFPPLLRHVLQNSISGSEPENLETIFTKQEMTVYKYLKDNTNKVISRDLVGELVWDNEVDDKYSDWAIDQIIHRLRKKLKEASSPYKIITKKGRGFILRRQI